MLNFKLQNIYKYLFENIHIFIILLLILILVFSGLFNIINNKKNIEHYSGFITPDFLNFLKEKNYKINREKKIITKCNNENKECKEISYRYHFNTFNSILLCNDKFTTNKLLKNNNIPVPNSFLVPVSITSKNIESLLVKNNIKFPLVVKDNHGTFGLNVYTNINNIEKVMISLKELSKIRYNALIEEQIDGDCYRIFVFNKQIIDIIKREKPYIIGDGIKNIEELINIRNINQIKEKLYPTNINIEYINQQGYNLNSILELNKKIYITNIINFHNGSKVSRVDINLVPPKNLKIFVDICDILNIKCIGIDYLSKDITIEYNLNNGKILEINGTPDTEIHTLLKNNNEDSVAKYFFKHIVDNI
jgi:glutathione synthase/RimK-type ligase-like ATP-grasp enzyme